jgi:ribosomal protein L37E
MPTQKKDDKKEKLVTTRKSVHVVFFSCPDCGEETHHVEICSGCGTPMRVIDVVEKFGEEAEKFLKKVEDAINIETEDDKLGEDEPNIILMGDNDNVVDDAGIDPDSDESDYEDGLDVIFPSDDEDDSATNSTADADLASALDLLDAEEEDVSAEDFGFDDSGIPEL